VPACPPLAGTSAVNQGGIASAARLNGLRSGGHTEAQDSRFVLLARGCSGVLGKTRWSGAVSHGLRKRPEEFSDLACFARGREDGAIGLDTSGPPSSCCACRRRA
jgi:hypothetical protein